MRARRKFADGAAVFSVLSRRAVGVARAGTWLADAAIDEITLDYNSRHRRRFRLTAASGAEILLDLAETVHVRDGDALALEGGGLIAVRAAAEALLEVTAADADTLARLAWHLGNRHLSVQFLPGKLRILDDHVIAAMLPALGGTVRAVTAPFDPESGAYDHG
jgi:urease accessory protein